MRQSRFFLAAWFAAMLASPAIAQFQISVQQNGQAVSVSNGGTISVNAPAVGQTADATVTLTYLGATAATFAAVPQILGSGSFTSDVKPPVTIGSLSSATFQILFTSATSAQDVSQFTWAFTEAPTSGSTTTATVGVINFTLAGTTPNLVVSSISSNGNSVAIPNGGTFQFPNTPVNSSSSLTVAISNAGSGPSVVNSITATGNAFSLQGVPLLPVTLGSGAELRITVQFMPPSAGPQTSSLQISLGTGPYAASLAGNGTGGLLTYQIIQDGKTLPLAGSQTITMDATNVGATSSVVIQFQNGGATAVTVSSILTSGAGFSVSDEPFVPLTLPPQQSNTITLKFAPSEPGFINGRLLIGSDSFLLAGLALGPLLQYSYQPSGGTSVPVTAGDQVSFSPIAVGQTESLQFTITNAGNLAATIQSTGVLDTTGVFQVGNLALLPIQLGPNGSTSFTITFSPKTVGLTISTIVVNSLTLQVEGIALAPPPFPGYYFTGASGTQQPFQQPAVGLTLNAAYPVALTGTLTITIASDSFVSDPAVQFSTGGRQVAFSIPVNSLQAIFPNGASQIQLQTGTVAGNIIMQPTFALATGFNLTPASPTVQEIAVPSAAPTILAASISATSTTALSVLVTGFTTTRYLQHITFQFAAGTGFTLNNSQVTVDLSGASKLWFLSSASESTGGQFNVEIPFSFSGGNAGAGLTQGVASILIVVANDVGNSNGVQVLNP